MNTITSLSVKSNNGRANPKLLNIVDAIKNTIYAFKDIKLMTIGVNPNRKWFRPSKKYSAQDVIELFETRNTDEVTLENIKLILMAMAKDINTPNEVLLSIEYNADVAVLQQLALHQRDENVIARLFLNRNHSVLQALSENSHISPELKREIETKRIQLKYAKELRLGLYMSK
jgi:hypothetical protein